MPGVHIKFDHEKGIATVHFRANNKLVSPTVVVSREEAKKDSFDFAGARTKQYNTPLFKPAQAFWIRKQICRQLATDISFYPFAETLSAAFPVGGAGHRMKTTMSKQPGKEYINISIDGVIAMRYHPNITDTEFQKRLQKEANRIYKKTAFHLTDEKLDLIRSVAKQLASQNVIKKLMLKL